MKGTLEEGPDESPEKWPPAWADYNWAEYDQDDFEIDIRNRCQRLDTALMKR